MRLIHIAAIILLISSGNSEAQLRPGPGQVFEEAYDFFSYGEYSEAVYGFNALLKDDEENDHLRFLIAVCYLNIEGQKQRALPLLERAAKNISPDHIQASFSEKRAPVETLFYLGQAYRLGYRFDESIEVFNKLIAILGEDNDTQLIQRERNITENADMFYRNRKDIRINQLDNYPVTAGIHTNLVVSGDESVIVFTEPRKFYDAVLYSSNTGKGWSRPANITLQLGSDGLAYPVSLSWDGSELFLYRHDRLSNTNLYVSRRANNRWSTMEEPGENINSLGYEQHGSVTRDGKTLYFSSLRPAGEGGFDIYSSQKDVNNQWGPAENIGPPVNTPYDESFPFISPDGRTLYFSSTGHTGMGGYDIFISHKNERGEWTKPRNLGYPINTPDNDKFLIPAGEGKSAYLNIRVEGNNDLREFVKIEEFEIDSDPLSLVTIKLEDDPAVDYPYSSSAIMIQQLSPARTILSEHARITEDKYEMELPWGEFQIEISAPGYEPARFELDIPEYFSSDKYFLSMAPIRVTDEEKLPEAIILRIEPVLFGFDSYELDEKATAIISGIAEFMNRHTETRIELKGFTDAIGSSGYNLWLAGRRAESVAQTLVNNSVDRDRIITTPVGMDKYIANNITADGRDNPEGRKYNRRVEFIFFNLPEGTKTQKILKIPDNLKID
jgi:outer membrane protein OmpA-like peptidoglycan-associated protein